MTETPHPWDRLDDETLKAYNSFLAYLAMGARRSVREAARQHYAETVSSGEEITTVNVWLGWSAKYKWVSRGLARDEWIARTSDEQIIKNLAAAKLTLTRRARKFLKSTDGADFLRGARALALHFPPVQRVEDVTDRIPDLSDLSDEALERMREIRDKARQKAKGEE